MRNRRFIGCVAWYLGIGCCVAVPGQPGLSRGDVRTWTRQDGLPDNSVTAVIQARDGYLWVATTAGLVRFDGVRFTPIPLPGAQRDHGVSISALCEDSLGNLWIGTHQDGLFCRGREGLIRYGSKEGLLAEEVTSLAADTQGAVWIGTRLGLNCWDGHGFVAFTEVEGLTDPFVTGVHVSRSGVVWITTRSGMFLCVKGRILVYKFETDSQGRNPEYLGAYEDRHGDLWAFGDTYLINLAEGKRFNYFRGAEAASVRIWSLCEGRDGRLWIGTSGRGLFCFDNNRFQPVALSGLSRPYDMRAICEDREGNLWLGTLGGGLVQVRPQSVQFLLAGQGLPDSAATCMAIDSKGIAYVGLESGGVYLAESGRYESLVAGGGLDVPARVTSLCVGADDILWIGTIGSGVYGFQGERGVRITTANGLHDDSVLALCSGPDGVVYAGSEAGALQPVAQGGVIQVGRVGALAGFPITALLPRRAGGVYVGTAGGTVLLQDQGHLTALIGVDARMDGSIMALHEDSASRLWVGSAGGGLACRSGERWTRWGKQDGLPDAVITGVLDDSDGDFWLAAGQGIYRAQREETDRALVGQGALKWSLVRQGGATTHRVPEAGWPRAVEAADGQLWFATGEGVLSINSRGVAADAVSLPVYIEQVLAEGHPLEWEPASHFSLANSNGTRSVTLPVPLRALEIQFTALHFSDPGRVRFRHKLEGFDDDWVEDARERRVRYPRLPYGHYRFRVGASVTGDTWTEASSAVALIVPTPLWFRPWAIGLYVLAAVGAITGTVRYVSHRRLRHALASMAQQQALERERMRIAQDMHDEVGSKLTKISFLSEHARMDASGKVPEPLANRIESIANSSRDLLQTLDEIVWAVNPHNDTLEHLAAYLRQYADEYFQNTSIECEMRLPRTIPHHPLSAEERHNIFLTFEEALNNVLKHSGATKVRILMQIHDHQFMVEISDNGQGFSVPQFTGRNRRSSQTPTERGGNGLLNMCQRMSAIGGEYQIQSQAGSGTTIQMRIRLSSQPGRPGT